MRKVGPDPNKTRVRFLAHAVAEFAACGNERARGADPAVIRRKHDGTRR